MKRRTALAAIASAAAWHAGSLHAQGTRAEPASEAYEAALKEGEVALVRGDADGATLAFEGAARMRHTAESELGLVHAAMQLGRYGEALGFCAHVAGSHLDTPVAAALYAWLLRVGGQGQVAEGVVAKALARSPDDDVMRMARDALAAQWPTASGPLLLRPARMAPESWSIDQRERSLPGARTICSGVVVDAGARVLVPADALGQVDPRRLWVRNGLGTTTAATVETIDGAASGLAVLRLTDVLPLASDAMAEREPFAGSPGFVLQYAVDRAGAPAWPLLWQGFLGTQSRDGPRRVGIDVPSGNPGGGPVLDAGGRIVGATFAISDGLAFVPRSSWPQPLARPVSGAAAAGRSALIPLDRAYERGLYAAVQVLFTDL